MSSYITEAIHKATGEVHEILAWDDYFGRHRYGYTRNREGDPVMTEKEFRAQYEEDGQ